MNKTLKIVLTGAESTGKSILSEGLANHFNAIWIPEIARGYVENLNHKYTYSDIETIARKQIETEKQIEAQTPLVFFDTWLIITKVWFDFVYGKHPEWLHRAISESDIDLFLVCDIDIPWVEDPLRENGGENRKKLHEIYLSELESYKFDYKIISGFGNIRLNKAIDTINPLITKSK